MALTGAQYQSMRTKFLGLLGSPYQGVSSSELDSFLGQLSIDVTGTVTAQQKSNADTLLAGYLSSPAYTATAANVAEFFAAAVATLPTITTALTGPRYLQLKQQFTGVLSYAGIRTEAQMLGYLAGYLITSDFGALFSSYSGLTVHVYARGDLGVSGTAGAGKSAWANQLGSGSNITTGVSATNGIGAVGAGLNSKASIVTDTSTQFGIYTLPTSVTPSITNRHIVKVKRNLVTPTGLGYQDTTSGVTTSIPAAQVSPAAEETLFNGTLGALTSGVVINQWYACRYSWIGGLDQIRIGAHEPAPISTGNNPLGTAWTFCGVNTASVSQEHLLYMVIDGPLATFLTAYADFCAKARAFWSTAIEI